MIESTKAKQISFFACRKNIPIISISITIFAIIEYVLLSAHMDYTLKIFVGMTSIIPTMLIGIMAIKLNQRYRETEALGPSFLFLAIAFISYSLAESFWLYFDMLGDDTYPGLSDISYVFYFVFAILYVATTLFYFIKKIKFKDSILFSLIVGSMMIIYYAISISYNEVSVKDGLALFDYGAIFVSLTSILLGLTVITAIRLKNDLKILWIIVSIAIMINSCTDLWYYTLENLGTYEYGIIGIDTGYFASFVILLFSLKLHRKLI